MKNLLRLSPVAVCGAVLWATVAFPARAEFKCDGRQLSRVDASRVRPCNARSGLTAALRHTHAEDLWTADARLRAFRRR